MVILGGLEVVAAGYLIHKHKQNKKEKQRIDDEAAALEEQQHRISTNDGRHRHRRSHSRDRRDGRDGHNRRRHSADAKYRREDARPVMSNAAHTPIPAPMPAPMPVPVVAQPPPYSAVVPPMVAQQAPPQDIKYGWTDDEPASSSSQQPNGQYPPTGWPAHWSQSQTPPANSSARLQPQKQQGRQREYSRGRSEARASSASPHVRFASPSVSPPPSYRTKR